MSEDTLVTLRVPKGELKEWEKTAKKLDMNRSRFIRTAINEYIEDGAEGRYWAKKLHRFFIENDKQKRAKNKSTRC
jgi:metal-responsive CopG/Arc/MetJ family transcriptional regulator